MLAHPITPAVDPATPKPLSPASFKPLLLTLTLTPHLFTAAHTRLAIRHLATGPTACTPAQIGAFLTALKLSGLEAKAEIVAACAAEMRAWSLGGVGGLGLGLEVPEEELRVDGNEEEEIKEGRIGGEMEEEGEEREDKWVVDIVGTGGDGQDTFNVSTTAGIVAAGAGAKVCKVTFISLQPNPSFPR